MMTTFTRRRALATLSLWGLSPLATGLLRAYEPREHTNDSGYSLRYTYSLDELIKDLEHGERGDPKREAAVPHHEWYTEAMRHHGGAWGPEQRHYPPLEGLNERPVQWRRERVIATAARFIGYEYQHHHVPDWNPPADWPWKKCCAGHNGKGVDCSNFTGFVYNQGFGIKMSTGIKEQAELHSAIEGHEHGVPVRKIELPHDYQQRQQVLRTGDLLYIRGKETGPITHVVIWVGSVGHSESGVPLIMDSHGGNVEDDHGKHIPCGIHLRPFREDSWYHRCASHAHRVFHD